MRMSEIFPGEDLDEVIKSLVARYRSPAMIANAINREHGTGIYPNAIRWHLVRRGYKPLPRTGRTSTWVKVV